MPSPYWYNTVGPVPFGHVEDLPAIGWREAIRALRPDIIYALLNWQAVPFARRVLADNPGVPFVWHFKEGPTLLPQRERRRSPPRDLGRSELPGAPGDARRCRAARAAA